MTAVLYLDEVLQILYTADVGPAFVLMGGNACSHRFVLMEDYLKNGGIACMERRTYSPALNHN